jgi:hypothetical protein
VEKQPSKRRTRTVLRLIVAVIAAPIYCLFICYGGLLFLKDRLMNGIRLEYLKADMNKRLPNGSTSAQAAAWFATHGIQPEVITDSRDRNIGLMAIISNSRLVQPAEIRIFVYFNQEGQLTERQIYRFVYAS